MVAVVCDGGGGGGRGGGCGGGGGGAGDDGGDILQPPGLGLDILYLEYCFIFGSYVLKYWGDQIFKK